MQKTLNYLEPKRDLKEQILLKVLQIKEHEKNKGTRNYRIIYNQLKKELLELIPYDKKIYEVGNFVLEKSFNPVLQKTICAIYTKDSFKRREDFKEFNKKQSLARKRSMLY